MSSSKYYIFLFLLLLACGDCANTDELVDFEECTYGGDVSGSTLEEHLNLIENGYCYCTDVDSKDKITVIINASEILELACSFGFTFPIYPVPFFPLPPPPLSVK